jgi:hypothetical protein
MNSNTFFSNLWRFLGLFATQAIFLKQVTVALGAYFNILLYPLFILFLPLQLATPYVVLLGFTIGMAVDFVYGTSGVHASAGAFSGYARSLIFYTFAPKGGYSGKELIFSPAFFGWQIFLQVAALFFVAHIFWYFSVDAFTFVYVGAITAKTLAAWILSMLFVVLYTALFNPND